MTDPHPRLIRAVLELAGGGAVAHDAVSRDWASATFVGERHMFAVTLPHTAADALVRALPDHDFAIPGHLVADIVVAGRQQAGGDARLRIEALTIEAH